VEPLAAGIASNAPRELLCGAPEIEIGEVLASDLLEHVVASASPPVRQRLPFCDGHSYPHTCRQRGEALKASGHCRHNVNQIAANGEEDASPRSLPRNVRRVVAGCAHATLLDRF
jgi:hypothetical protein